MSDSGGPLQCQIWPSDWPPFRLALVGRALQYVTPRPGPRRTRFAAGGPAAQQARRGTPSSGRQGGRVRRRHLADGRGVSTAAAARWRRIQVQRSRRRLLSVLVVTHGIGSRRGQTRRDTSAPRRAHGVGRATPSVRRECSSRLAGPWSAHLVDAGTGKAIKIGCRPQGEGHFFMRLFHPSARTRALHAPPNGS